jgi:GR25 family glycosyltransferase involved in LPS biosynthesis
MQLNVISLPSRADRRAQFSTWNERAGLEIAFVDAVWGAQLDRAKLARDGVLTEDHRVFSDGALGNALSHHALWRQAQSASGATFVCEDDACLRGDFAAQASALLAQLPDGWDIAFFGYNTNAIVAVESQEGLKTLLMFDEAAKAKPTFFVEFARLQAQTPALFACFQAWGTLCYAISPGGGARLLDACFPLSVADDLVMFGQNRTIKPYTLDGMLNLALQRQPIAAYCAYPPLALSANDVANSDVVTN